MLPVACLPIAGILYGIGYWIDPVGWGTNNIIAAFCIKAAAAIIDQIPLLFALGVAIGMADEQDGTSALAGLVSWLMITNLLSPNAVAMYQGVDVTKIPAAFGKIQNAFIGILAGIIGASCFNKFKRTELPEALAFFSGKRCVAIVTGFASIAVSVVLYYVWPFFYGSLVKFGISMTDMGPVGAGLYGMFNRLLIPLGLHHALNAVFWFDTAGINDLGTFWDGSGTLGVTGMYMTGFFPVMMFGLTAGAYAMFRAADPDKKNVAASLLLAGAFASFFTGITEPLEFSFMFLAPGLYVLHAVLTGASMALCAYLPVRCGFNFSAGLVDWILSFKAPLAVNPILIIPIGLGFAAVYYFTFKLAIEKFNLKTPGRGTSHIVKKEKKTASETQSSYTDTARAVLNGLGGFENLKDINYCATRLRITVNDPAKVNEQKINVPGVLGIVRPSKENIQIVIGTKVQFVFDELIKLAEAEA